MLVGEVEVYIQEQLMGVLVVQEEAVEDHLL
jgi:hypothetical protein